MTKITLTNHIANPNLNSNLKSLKTEINQINDINILLIFMEDIINGKEDAYTSMSTVFCERLGVRAAVVAG